jgi:hypothetical protein
MLNSDALRLYTGLIMSSVDRTEDTYDSDPELEEGMKSSCSARLALRM